MLHYGYDFLEGENVSGLPKARQCPECLIYASPLGRRRAPQRRRTQPDMHFQNILTTRHLCWHQPKRQNVSRISGQQPRRCAEKMFVKSVRWRLKTAKDHFHFTSPQWANQYRKFTRSQPRLVQCNEGQTISANIVNILNNICCSISISFISKYSCSNLVAFVYHLTGRKPRSLTPIRKTQLEPHRATYQRLNGTGGSKQAPSPPVI